MYRSIMVIICLVSGFSVNAYSLNTYPITKWHYIANGNLSNGTYVPGLLGFNVADVSSIGELNSLPSGVMGLVYTGYSSGGADSNFKSEIAPFIGNPRVFGFYLADEPDITGTWGTYYDPANLKEQSDYLHSEFPNAKTFIVLASQGPFDNPAFIAVNKNTGQPEGYNYANTHIDLFGIAVYPIQSQFNSQLSSNGQQFISNSISSYVEAAVESGIAVASMIPVYQAFGNYPGGSWIVPTATQEEQMMEAWAVQTPTPYFDFVYSWGVQKGDSAVSNTPSLQVVFQEHNSAPLTTSLNDARR